MAFTHLHAHTEYSLLDGSNKIKEYVKRVKELGMNSAAITDHGVMYGVIDFYRACKENGIKPIIGCEVYVAPNSRLDKEVTGGEERYHHLILLAENNTGYANLIKIVSKGFTEGYYYKPRVDMEVLREYSEGIIATSACLAGEVQRYLMKDMYEEAKKSAIKHEECFGKGNYFLELQDHGIREQGIVNQQLVAMSKELEIPLIATNDVHYTYETDVDSHDILLCIQTGKKLSDENRMHYHGGQFYIKSEEEMKELFPYALEALENTQKIADRCNVEIEFGHSRLPHFEVPEGYTQASYLRKLCLDGMYDRYQIREDSLSSTSEVSVSQESGNAETNNKEEKDVKDASELLARLDFELATIEKMGYVDYFLIVWDFINFAKKNGIAVGPGRGSAAGSIVSYALKITDVDPIKYKLLFERFLNPERVSMPDIDIDFCFERRQEVIDYVNEKYGQEKVVQIVTFGTMAARGVIRDVARVMDLPYSHADKIAKMIPNELNITIERALEINPELRKIYENDNQIQHLINMCKRLEGLPRHTSMHAAGVVICPSAADDFVPLSRGSDGAITTQFTMTTLEELGLLKMDFLGLRTLTVIQKAAELVEKSTGKIVDLDTLDYDDKEVLAYIGSGKTEGVFQLEGSGMTHFMKELRPQSLEDIIAGISLYRPGPMEFIPQYIKGKNSKEEIKYLCPELEPILSATYGCIVYQEQVMQIVRDLGGYSLGRSDLVRRAMSKKKQSVMEKERANFVYGNELEGVPGCKALGIDEAVAGQIYDNMMDFAKYAFNKSHAVCYAVVAYQTAYLKYYYPVQYMAALLSSVIDKTQKVTEYIVTCKGMGIQILPPNVNESNSDFAVVKLKNSDVKQYDMAVRYALLAIKGVGKPLIEQLCIERKSNGIYKNIQDLIERLHGHDLNKRALENMIKAGALDELKGNRKQFIYIYQQLIDKQSSGKKNHVVGQMTLMDMLGEEEKQEFDIVMPDVEEYPKEELLMMEKEVLGLYLSGHPLESYMKVWEKKITAFTSDFLLDEETNLVKVHDNETRIIGGIINEKTIKYTKQDKQMAFIQLEDVYGVVEVVIFPKVYEKFAHIIIEDEKVFIKGRVNVEEERNAKLICESITSFGEMGRKLWIKFDDMKEFELKEKELLDAILYSEGRDEVAVFISNPKSQKTLPPKYNVEANEELLGVLYEKFGKNNVKLV